MEATGAGMDSLSIVVLYWKALFPMAVTGYPSSSAGSWMAVSLPLYFVMTALSLETL